MAEAEQQQQSGGGLSDDGGGFGLPAAVLEVLPSDPYEQLDVARKITSIALAGRVSRLESEAAILRQVLDEKDDLIAELRSRLETLEVSLADAASGLARAQQEKETLLNENASLTNTIKKLNRDVSRLEVFRKTLMQSLQEEDDTEVGTARVAPKIRSTGSISTGSLTEDDEDGVAQNKPYVGSQLPETENSVSDDVGHVELDGLRQGRTTTLLTSHGSTPRFTPPDSPPRLSATGSPTRSSKPVSPRKHSKSFSTARNIFDDRSSLFSSLPSSHHSSMSSPFDTGAQAGRTRVDGKEFFRQVRSRLSYEQFSAFLVNVKELNAHKQTKEETLQKADEIFGPDNKDLYTIFEGLINRNLH